MKKALSLILALVMCLSLCACGGDEPNGTKPNQTEPLEEANQLNLCQDWKSIATGEVIYFDEEGYFHIYGDSYPYRYDEASSKVLVDVGVEVSLVVTLVDGIYRIDVEGEEFAPASAYEQLHAKYAKSMMVVPGFDGTPALNAALVKEHISRVELTVDNWREYIKVYSYEVEVIERDAFGEITKSEKSTVSRMGYGTDRYYYLDVVIELKHKETGEITVYGPASHQGYSFFFYQEPIDLDDYECTRIKGYLYFIDYPDEVFEEVIDRFDRWSKDRENASIKVTSSSMEGTWSVDYEAKVIENDSGSFGDYFD